MGRVALTTPLPGTKLTARGAAPSRLRTEVWPEPMGFVEARQFLPVVLVWAAVGCGSGADAARAEAHNDNPVPGGPGSIQAEVLPGIEVLLRDSLHLVRNRRIGLVTNHTGIDRARVSSIDRLFQHPEVDLVALYAPEHGIRGQAQAGVLIESGRDEATGLPIHSLYGTTRKPTPEMLRGVDALLFDIQDIGARYYTYVYTMALAMEAAGEAGIPMIVLDRPNPIGGETVQGNVLDPAFSSFVGLYPLPMRHGMTPGELARLFRGAFGVLVELHVVPVAGWSRAQWFDDTGLPWVPPSPNMPSLESATHYPGTCLFEGTSLSVGRGTPIAFQQIGAPWIDGEELVRRLEAYAIPGVRFEAVRFTPVDPGDGKHPGVESGGVRFLSTDRSYDPTAAALAALIEARALSGDDWAWREGAIDRLAGTDRLRRDIDAARSYDDILAGWRGERDLFVELRNDYLIYR